MRRRERSNDSASSQRQRQKRMGDAMAKGQRKLQEASAHLNPIGNGKTKLVEELLLMIRRRMVFAKDAGISKIRLEMVTLEQAMVLIELLERETRR